MKLRLKALGLLLLFCLATCSASPKYVFFFIGDGMGLGAVSLSNLYNRTINGTDTLLTMMQLPVTSFAFTHSASSPVTDSAAAGTALATGHKTNNTMLGVTPDSAAVNSIATVLHDHGFGVGLVTSVAPDDATPGAFYAHQPNRSMFYEIGCDAARSGFEFIAGANLRGLKDKKGKPTDLMETLEANGVAVVRGLEALDNTDSRRIMLLGKDLAKNNAIGYTIDSLETTYKLPAMTQACLDHLLKVSPDKFFMMVEGGDIDHGAHSNDAATTVMETLEFDKALRIAYNFYLRHPDETLILVTADHETGGLMLANKDLHYTMSPAYLRYPRMSKDAFSDYCKSLYRSGAEFSWPEMKEYLSDRLGFYRFIPVSESEDKKLKESFDKVITKRDSKDEKGLYNTFNEFSVVVFNLIDKKAGVGWTTNDHSGTPVPVFAAGVGAEKFCGVKDNTELPRTVMTIVLGEDLLK